MPRAPKPAFIIPKLLGAVVDLLYTTRQTRLLEQKDINEYKATETALKEHLIAELPKSEATGTSGKLANARITTKPVPAVEDWDKLYEFVRKKKRFDLLQRRLNDEAVKEMWDRGEAVPGVGVFNAVDVSVTKL